MTIETPTAGTNATDTGSAAPQAPAPQQATAPAGGEQQQPQQAAPKGEPAAQQPQQAAPQGDPAAADYTDFTVPEGVTFNTEALSEFKELARAKGLSQEDAQAFADLGVKIAKLQQDGYARQIEQAQTQWAETSRTDKEIGGDKFDENRALAKRALDTFGSEELTTMLAESGLGNHPEVLRAFVRVGRAISEDRLVPGATRPTGDRLKAMYPTMHQK